MGQGQHSSVPQGQRDLLPQTRARGKGARSCLESPTPTLGAKIVAWFVGLGMTLVAQSAGAGDPSILTMAQLDLVTAGAMEIPSAPVGLSVRTGTVTSSSSSDMATSDDGETVIESRSLAFAYSLGGEVSAHTASDSGASFASSSGKASATGGDDNLATSTTVLTVTKDGQQGHAVSSSSARSTDGGAHAATMGIGRSDDEPILIPTKPGSTLSAFGLSGGGLGVTTGFAEAGGKTGTIRLTSWASVTGGSVLAAMTP